MFIRGRIVVIVFWIASLVAVGVLASAQSRQNEPAVISGNDIGFRPEGVQRGNRLTGTLVVRVNGQWVDAQFASKVGPASD